MLAQREWGIIAHEDRRYMEEEGHVGGLAGLQAAFGGRRGNTICLECGGKGQLH